jgi:hypothetical protein
MTHVPGRSLDVTELAGTLDVIDGRGFVIPGSSRRGAGWIWQA